MRSFVCAVRAFPWCRVAKRKGTFQGRPLSPSNNFLISGKCLNTQIILGSVLSMTMRTSFWKSSESRAFEDLAKQYEILCDYLQTCGSESYVWIQVGRFLCMLILQELGNQWSQFVIRNIRPAWITEWGNLSWTVLSKLRIVRLRVEKKGPIKFLLCMTSWWSHMAKTLRSAY